MTIPDGGCGAGASLAPPATLAAGAAVVAAVDPLPLLGRVEGVTGLIIEAAGPAAGLGDLAWISPVGGPPPPFPDRNGTGDGTGLWAEVVGFRDGRVLLTALEESGSLAPGWEVRSLGRPLAAPVGRALLGRVIDGLGRPLDGRGPLAATATYPVSAPPPQPLQRQRITAPLPVGVRAIDGLLTCGRGQRMGIFAGSGVGKSTLLGMMARGTAAAVNVIALVGERGREVRDFIEGDLGPAGLARSVVVVATSDRPAVLRLKGALLATAIAEWFRDQGEDVLLLMDSVTRLAMAQREVGLAAGEPPTARGYTPSVFALLPRLLERAGPGDRGSITAFYTVLVDGDDFNDPIADTVRSILDGHIVLSRRLAAAGQYPAVDLLASVSRVMSRVAGEEHRRAAQACRAALATYHEAEDLLQVGAYQPGTHPDLDRAIEKRPRIRRYLEQDPTHCTEFTTAVQELLAEFPPEGR